MATRVSTLPAPTEDLHLPQEVKLLLRREREIATIVYALRAATAEQVVERLPDALANASVRSMLNRLVAKGILKRILSGRVYFYMPALTTADSGVRALRQFAEDYFEGSMAAAAQMMNEALSARRGPQNDTTRRRRKSKG